VSGLAYWSILPAPAVQVMGGTFAYDGNAHPASAIAYNVDGVTQLGGTFSYTYNGSTTPPSAPGTYAVVATFTSNDPNYGDAVGTGTVTIGTSAATPTVTVSGGPFTYDGQPHAASATATGAGGVSVPGTFMFTYNGSPAAPTAAGTYAVVATFASADPNYSNAVGTGSLTITPAILSATGLHIKATAGAPFRGAVATFTDPFANQASYSATITWGDGATSAGVISGTGTLLKVTGSHTYADPGSYTVQVTISHTSPALRATTTSTATVRSSGEDVQPHETQTIDFWHSQSGQSLLLGFNGGAKHTQLAAWLATNFPDLYGPAAGANNLTGKTNKDVAALFQSLYLLANDNADVQVLATALNVYATTSSLGGNQGVKYGFQVSASGLGAQLFGVENWGAAFGVANNTKRNVFELLRAVDQQVQNGILYNGNTVLQSAAEDLLDALNAGG
jgi:hypothetical protein